MLNEGRRFLVQAIQYLVRSFRNTGGYHSHIGWVRHTSQRLLLLHVHHRPLLHLRPIRCQATRRYIHVLTYSVSESFNPLASEGHSVALVKFNSG